MTATLEWSFNPWRERPGAAAVAAVAGLGTCLLVARLGQPWLVTAGLCLALLAALSPLLSPAHCRLDRSGISRRGPFGVARRGWGEIRRVVERPTGVLVTPYARPHWLDAHRGLLLPLPRHDRVSLLAALRAGLAADGGPRRESE